jgi:preprotein translocase subunit SecB
MAEEQQAAAQEQNQQAVFSIEKLYIKDISLEVPNAPHVFLQQEAPQVGIELGNAARAIGDGVFEVEISATVTSKVEENIVFLVEVKQAGIFQIRNVPEENMEAILGVTCPNILFPYVRETVSDLVSRAGFPPVLLSPINFEALFMQQKAQQQQAEQAGATTH